MSQPVIAKFVLFTPITKLYLETLSFPVMNAGRHLFCDLLDYVLKTEALPSRLDVEFIYKAFVHVLLWQPRKRQCILFGFYVVPQYKVVYNCEWREKLKVLCWPGKAFGIPPEEPVQLAGEGKV